jgi:hypothetical protein
MFLDFFNDIAQEPFNKQANQYAARLLSSVVSDSLVSSGVNISSNTARQTLDNVMMQLMDLTRSTVPASGAAAEEASARILPLLKNAAGEIFGPQEGANALPKLVHAITDAMNEASPMAATYMSKLGPVIDTEAVQNASLAYSFSQAARLKNALAAVTTGKVATQEQIGLALGKLQTLKNTGDWGAIDLEDKNIRAALSELSAGAGVGRLSDVLKEGIAREKAYRTTKEKLGQEAVGMETEAEIKARRATLAGKIRAGKLKAEMISNKMNELRNAPR